MDVRCCLVRLRPGSRAIPAEAQPGLSLSLSALSGARQRLGEELEEQSKDEVLARWFGVEVREKRAELAKSFADQEKPRSTSRARATEAGAAVPACTCTAPAQADPMLGGRWRTCACPRVCACACSCHSILAGYFKVRRGWHRLRGSSAQSTGTEARLAAGEYAEGTRAAATSGSA